MRRWTLLGAAAVTFIAAQSAGAEPFRFALNWLPQGEHCGFFQALGSGLYDAAGLEVEILSGGPDVNPPILLAAGQVDAAMGSSFTSLNMLAEGIPGVTVASMFQKDPQTLVAHPGQGIDSLEDMAGRGIMVAPFSRGEYWQFLKARFGFQDSQLRPYNYNPAPFLADPAAIQQGYVTEDGFFFGELMEGEPQIFLLADHGYQNYATTIFTMAEFVETQPQMLQAFIDATAAGYAQCLAGEDQAAWALVAERNPDHGEALWDYKLTQMRERGMVDGGDAARLGIGAMTETRWREFFDTMVAAGVYPDALPFEDAFTLRFIGGS